MDQGGYPKRFVRVGARKQAISFVLSLFESKKKFSGGELHLRDPGRGVGVELSLENRRVVFFLSRYEFEIEPVRVPSKRFRDSLFVIEGTVKLAGHLREPR